MRAKSFLYWMVILSLSQAAEESKCKTILDQPPIPTNTKERVVVKDCHEGLSFLEKTEVLSVPIILEPEETKRFNEEQLTVVVIIDVFRAFTTAPYVLEKKPASYMLSTKSTVISRLLSKCSFPFLIGKPEKGITLNYNIPNSPTLVKEAMITGQNILHRTEGGAKGVLDAKGADIVLASGLVNADATVQFIKNLKNPQVKIVPMGHEGVTPSLEDDICAQYINAKLQGQTISLSKYHSALREGAGSYFFSEDQRQYPSEDFDCCLELDRFNFVIQADVREDYAILSRLDG